MAQSHAKRSPPSSAQRRAQIFLDQMEAPLKAVNRLIMATPVVGQPLSVAAAKAWESLHLMAGRR